MNGAQDLGGMMGFGPVVAEEDEPLFHYEWERRAFALTLALGFTGEWNIDASRHARESIPPADYLAKSYYEIWLAGIEKLLLERDLIRPEEITLARSAHKSRPVKRVLAAVDVEASLKRGGPADRPVSTSPAFKVGDRVRALNMHPEGHTRIPRYVRGCEGVIRAVHGAHVFPDNNAHGKGETPKWLYNVSFRGTDVWGVDSDPALNLSVDLWEPYLERL